MKRPLPWILVVLIVLGAAFAARRPVMATVRRSQDASHQAALEEHRATGPRPVVAAGGPGSAFKGAWPQFRGPNRTGVADQSLKSAWPPKKLWTQPVGGGLAGIAVKDGRTCTLEQRKDAEVLACYDTLTGVELWVSSWDGKFKDNEAVDGPRTTPTIEDDRIYVVGGAGEIRAVNLMNGELVWRHNLIDDYDAAHLRWGSSASPVIMGTLVIGATSGKPAAPGLVAFDKKTGQEIWISEWFEQGYATPEVATLTGKQQIVHLGGNHLYGIDPATGDIVWKHPWVTNMGIAASQPLFVGEDQILVSSGYGTGIGLVKLSAEGVVAKWAHQEVEAWYTSPVQVGDTAYLLSKGSLVALDIATGEVLWRGGDYGEGQIIKAGKELVVLADDGRIGRITPSREAYTETASFQALNETTWNPPAMAGNLLFVRGNRNMAVFEL